MTSRKITVRGIFNESGELVRFLYQNGGGKSYFMDCEPSKDASIDEFFMEMMPPQTVPDGGAGEPKIPSSALSV
jgi:hypothetical protein